MAKRAFLTGITGQDGAYLAENLLARGYEVHGLCRPSSSHALGRLGALGLSPDEVNLHTGDVGDSGCLLRLMQELAPDEVYHLAAQSHVPASYTSPEYTANADALGTLRLLEAVRLAGLGGSTRIFHAATAELLGPPEADGRLDECSGFHPRSPYGAAKLYAYWIIVNYREAYGLHASNGVLFNHESPLRGDGFVTRKIARAAAALARGAREPLRLGALDARRDWGHARDFVEAMRRILAQSEPDDYVIATGTRHRVRDFVDLAFAHVGRPVVWEGEGAEERGLDADSGEVRVVVDPALYRPGADDGAWGDARKTREKLGWAPATAFAALVGEMVDHERARSAA